MRVGWGCFHVDERMRARVTRATRELAFEVIAVVEMLVWLMLRT